MQRALSDPETSLRMLDALDAEDSLRAYIPLVWDVLEPARQLVWGWAVEAICEHLEAVTRGELRRLLINVPPGCMKSLTTNVLWPSWEWGPRNMPHTRYVTASYSEALTVRDNRRTRNIINSRAYQELWGDRYQLTSDQNAKVRFDTDKTGFKIATSVGGLGTGERGDRFIIDDPHNVKDGESEAKREAALQWFSEVVPTRLNDPDKSAIIVIMQRVHERDVSGLILASELGYDHLCLPMEYEQPSRCYTTVPREGIELERVTRVVRENDPLPKWMTPEELDAATAKQELPPAYEPAWRMRTPWDQRDVEGDWLWPERFSERHVEEDLKPALRAWGGTYAEAGQLQQRPSPRGGGMFKRGWWQYVDEVPSGGMDCRAYDLAASTETHSAWTVGMRGKIVRGSVYITDIRREQFTPGQVDELILETAKRDGKTVHIDIPQDPGQAGKAQKAHMAKLLHGWPVSFSPESGDKTERARGPAAQCEAGNVYLLRAPWNDTLVREAALFPNGHFKDQVDAFSRLYAHLIRKREGTIGAAPQVIGMASHG